MAALKSLDQLITHLSALETNGRDLTPAFKASGMYMRGSIERNFRAQGRPQRWQALAPVTLAGRRKGKGQGSAQILVNNADLKNSFSEEVTNSSVEIGTNKVQARRLHFGYPGKKSTKRTRYKRGANKGKVKPVRWQSGHTRTPARPFLMFQTEDYDQIAGVFNRHLFGR
ncbi:MAG: phage virion morphogenesis protein [Pyrinomonadaceae bacterium MAG19_C2-C3]|nr:phage virion morphogenesis protein [Pyrinomonadaceae bacterium MAG19_C2-C3]